jgi:sRNA-binding regulator protein Hfq
MFNSRQMKERIESFLRFVISLYQTIMFDRMCHHHDISEGEVWREASRKTDIDD